MEGKFQLCCLLSLSLSLSLMGEDFQTKQQSSNYGFLYKYRTTKLSGNNWPLLLVTLVTIIIPFIVFDSQLRFWFHYFLHNHVLHCSIDDLRIIGNPSLLIYIKLCKLRKILPSACWIRPLISFIKSLQI